jgi:hypothetical protein
LAENDDGIPESDKGTTPCVPHSSRQSPTVTIVGDVFEFEKKEVAFNECLRACPEEDTGDGEEKGEEGGMG